MNETNYKVILNMGWEYIVAAKNEKEALNKVKLHAKSLFTKDGYSVLSFEAQQNIEHKNYTIDPYTVFLID